MTEGRSLQDRIPGILAVVAVVLATLFGLYARFRGIGTWPLADDEYHTTESVGNILKHGLPAFECGGYYVRGILYQYLLALLSFLPGTEQVTLFRSVTVLSNLLCLPPLYLMARRLGGSYVAMGAIVLFMLSVWEVEYARYIRMYAPFQAVFVWYLYFLFRILVDKDNSCFKWIYLLSIVSIFIYEAGIFLVLLNFFPVLSGKARMSVQRVLLPVIILASAYYLLTFNFMFDWADDYLSLGLAPRPMPDVNTLGHLVIPNAFLYALNDTPDWYGGFSLLLVALAGILYLLVRSRETHYSYKLIFTFWILLAVTNQYSLIIYSLAVFWLIGWLGLNDIRGRDLMYLVVALLVTAAFWLIYALNTSAWHALFAAGVEDPLWKMLVMFLKYPNLLDKIFRPWMGGIPVTTSLSAILIVAGVMVSGKDADPAARQYFRVLAALAIILGVLVGLTLQPYNNSRYTFFMYPLIILLVLYSISRIMNLLVSGKKARTWLFLLMTGSFVALADDYDFRHLAMVDSADINYRTVYNTQKTFHLFNRMDFRTPAEYVNERKGPDDIVIASVRPAHHYLDRLDYFYVDSRNRELPGIVACGGEKEIWTNARLLYNEEMLTSVIDDSGRQVWLIIRSNEYPYIWKGEKLVGDTYSGMLVYKSIDDAVAVYRFGD